MLLYILSELKSEFTFFNIFQYITFRSLFCFLAGFFLTSFLTPIFIKIAKSRAFGQPVRDDGPTTHYTKANTPTMGGIVIFLVTCTLTLSFTILTNTYIILFILCYVSFSLIGLVDDIKKLKLKSSGGLSEKSKLVWQALAGVAITVILLILDHETRIHIPFTKDTYLFLG
ncbi:MAG: phospho-N-acetylmuramoyl-pentapeptide-transferase, partial [Deltaproteobacteria bacterium]|nr:phospho-N-acetylmuramoyl-pentapeptide-transferase [Deltaproteobacteria bacterium]